MSPKVKNFICLFLLTCLTWTKIYAESKDFIKDLSADWLVFDVQDNAFKPTTNNHSKSNSISQWLDLRAFKGAYLSIAAEKDLSLFIDNKLLFVSPRKGNFRLSVDSLLYELKGNQPNKQMLLTVWHPKGLLPWKEFRIVYKSNNSSDFTEKIDYLEFGTFKTRLTFLISFMLLLILVIKQFFPYELSQTLTFFLSTKVFSDTARAYNSIFSIYNILVMLFYSLSLMINIYIVENRLDIDFTNFSIINNSLWIKLPFYTIGILGFMFSKYLIFIIIGKMLNITKVVQGHFIYSMQMNGVIGLFLWGLSLVYMTLSGGYFGLWLNTTIIILALLFIYKLFKLFNVLRIIFKFRISYLFLYLCTLELIPLVILFQTNKIDLVF